MNKPFQTFFRGCVCGWVRVEPPPPTFMGATSLPSGGLLKKEGHLGNLSTTKGGFQESRWSF